MDNLPHNRRQWMPTFTITMYTFMTVLLCIRVVSRLQRGGSTFGIDDVCILLAWAIGTASSTLLIITSNKYGMNEHSWDVPPSLWVKGTMYAWIIEMLFFWSTCLVKVSILLFYRRLVEGACTPRFKWALWFAIAFVVAYTFTWFSLICTTCVPLEAQWRMYDPTYDTPWHCASSGHLRSLSILGGTLSVVTDAYCVLLPAMLVLRTRLTKRQKIGLIFIFGLGLLVVVAGATRTVYLARVESDSDIDKTWNGFNVFVAGIAELHLAIICACAPSLKYVFGRYFGDGGSKESSARNMVLGHGSTSETSGTGSGSTMGEQSRGEMDNPMAKYTMGKETWYLDTETGSTGELSRTVE